VFVRFGNLVRAGIRPVDYDPKIRMRGAMQLRRSTRATTRLGNSSLIDDTPYSGQCEIVGYGCRSSNRTQGLVLALSSLPRLPSSGRLQPALFRLRQALSGIIRHPRFFARPYRLRALGADITDAGYSRRPTPQGQPRANRARCRLVRYISRTASRRDRCRDRASGGVS
jgi:hypothetical protein